MKFYVTGLSRGGLFLAFCFNNSGRGQKKNRETKNELWNAGSGDKYRYAL